MPSALPRVGPDIGPILSLVRKSRLLLRGSWGAIGIGLTLGFALAVLAIVTTADMLVPLVGPWVRLAGLLLFSVPTIVVLVWKCLLPLSRRLRGVEIARRIESKIPGMHSRLVSCMDLAGREADVSSAFYRKLVDESLDRIGKYRSTSVVDFRSIGKASRFALIGGALFAALWLGFGAHLTTALARVFNPFADLPPTSNVEYTVEPGATKVLIGEDLNFVVTVTKGEPESLVVELVGKDTTIRHSLKKDEDGIWRLGIRGLSSERGFEQGFTFRVFGGRTWSKESRVDWTERPVLLDTHIKLHFPDYMAISEPRAVAPKQRDVVGPADSRVEVAVDVEGDVAAGEIELLESRVVSPPNHERRWFNIPLPAANAKCEFFVAGRYPLHQASDRLWVGSFPLNGAGGYRIELRNELGHANKPLSNLPKYEALVDQPPFVHIDRPGDLVLSKPDKVAITIGVRDDYGLRDLWIATQKEGELTFTRTMKVKDYPSPDPLKVDALVAMLDLTAGGLNLKAGETLRYRAEVRDRRLNSEAVFSKDFSIHIAEDPNAADKLLDAFEKGQETLREKLANLIAEQKKIKEKVDEVHANAPDKAALRKDFAELAVKEQKNVSAAAAIEQELKNLAAQAQKNSLLNEAINKEMQNLSNQFKNTAFDPLQDLANKLQQAANPAQPTPDLKGIKNQSDRVQKNLESMKGKMDALANAQNDMKTDTEKALAKLKDDLLKEQGKVNARDLEELKDVLKNLRDELAKLQGKQEDLADETQKSADNEVPEIEKKQLTLDEQLKKDLDLARKLLDREKAKQLPRSEFPDDPFKGTPKERRVAPKEDDTQSANGPKQNAEKQPEKKDGMDVPEDLFKPALKGEREKLDPRFEKKIRPMPRKKGQNEPADKRDDLREHQQDNLRELDAAQKGLKSDEQTLEDMIKSLMNASQKSESNPKNDPSDKSPTDQLSQMLKSEAMKDAMQMAQRAKQNGKGSPQQGKPTNQPPTGTAKESTSGNSVGGIGMLDDLDPRTRATILQLPARVREELLQGMKTQGPEGYQKFIQEYFRRLAEVPK
jgi:hypothetical protein